jgi:hypothetical protein
MNKKEFWAKARFFRSFNNPGLKPGVIDNEFIMDFSPKPDFLKYFRSQLYQKFVVLLLIPDTHNLY